MNHPKWRASPPPTIALPSKNDELAAGLAVAGIPPDPDERRRYAIALEEELAGTQAPPVGRRRADA